MEVYRTNQLNFAALHKNFDNDEYIVRKALLKVWTRTLEKYARPGMIVPPLDVAKQELLNIGLEKAVKALCKEHWFVFSFMVREEIRGKIEKELNRIDLQDFLNDVEAAQCNPALLQHLRNKLRHAVLG